MNWKRAMIAALFAVPVVILLGWGFTRNPATIPSPLPGKPAPAFTVSVFSPGEQSLARAVGDTISLDAIRGKIIVLNFWASWCLPCRDEHIPLSEGAVRYAGKPVQFLGVLYNDQPPAALQWIKEMGGQSYPSALDNASHTAIDYGIYGVPETFFIDAGGKVAHKELGPVTPALLNRVLDSLLATMPGDTAANGKGQSANGKGQSANGKVQKAK